MKAIKLVLILLISAIILSGCCCGGEPYEIDLEAQKALLLKDWSMSWMKENEVMLNDWQGFELDLSNIYAYTSNSINQDVFKNRDGWVFGGTNRTAYDEMQRSDGIIMYIYELDEDHLLLKFQIGEQKWNDYQVMTYEFYLTPK